MNSLLSGFTLRTKLPLLLSVLIATISQVAAKNLPDPSSGCQLTVADDWAIVNPPAPGGYAVEAVKGDHTKAVEVFVEPVSSTASTDTNSPLVQGIESGYQKSGGKIVSCNNQKLNDITFCVLTGTQDNGKGNVIQTTLWMTVAAGHMYEVCLYDFGGDPAKDAELTAALNSFSISAK